VQGLRVHDLFGNGAGGYTGPLLNTQTIARDAAINQLTGGNGMDWFWFWDSGRAGDTISGYGSGEVATFE
jgi:Ca2+-binding RTX toxin-like protein